MVRIRSFEEQVHNYVGERVEVEVWSCDDYEETLIDLELVEVTHDGDLKVRYHGAGDRDDLFNGKGIAYGVEDTGDFYLNGRTVLAVKSGKPATDPKHYATEAQLAVAMFRCSACSAAPGTGCMDGGGEYTRVSDPHISRVDLLRSLRAYVNGKS